ncbi:ribonuclease H-like domain-containing protein [Tanacetum coccineum]|uniref:Ribonuclease H-like domain-containing protein n=1 Tax=Tanacetum coccineum TaxID=301880 RepID=A0ABQ5AM36_9ASTR
MSDYSLWEVILNGNKVLKRTVRETDHEYEPTTTEEKQDRRNEMKARGTLLMALPNKDQLKFYSYKDAKLLMEAIEKRYGGNKESKKVQRTLLKQQYENFAGSRNTSTTLIARLPILNPGEYDLWTKVECYNCHKNGHFARECRAPRNQENRGRENSRRTVTVETLTENALVAQDGIGGYDWSYQAEEEHPTNFALMAHTSSGSSSNSDFEVDSCSKSFVKAYATLKEQYDSLSLDYKRSQFNLVSYKLGLESVEARLAHYKKNKTVFEESINVLNLEVKLRDNALVENKKKLEKAKKERDELKLTLEKFQNSSKSLNNLLESQVIDKFKTGLGYNAASSTAASPAVESFVNSSEMLENQENNKSKSDKGYHAVPPPYTGNFIPFKPDLTFMDEIVKSENIDVITIVTPSNGQLLILALTDQLIPAAKKQPVSHPRPISNAYKKGYSQDTRPFNKYSAYKNSIFNKKVNTVRVKDTTARDRAVGKPQQKEYKEKGVINSGCSRHMTGNKCYLTEYEDYDGGFVFFGDGKGRISRKGNGPDWLFDVDSLTISMNYVPVVAGNQTNGIARTRDNIVTGQAEKKIEPELEYILIPICTTDPLISQGHKDSEEDAGVKPTKLDKSETVDVHLYRSMIGSLMYLTASRPDIMFAVWACARFQVTPKMSHLHAVNRIFRYLKGQPKLGLWYPRDSPFDLEAFFNSNYAGASLDRKSTTGGCQFLGKRLISWQCKKQTIVANSTTEAEYVAAANCCRQVLGIQNQILDYRFNFMNTKIYIDNESTIYIVKNPVFHSKTKHIEIRHHFIRDSYEKRLIQVIKIHTDHNVEDLLTKAFDVSKFNFLVASIADYTSWMLRIECKSCQVMKMVNSDKKELAIPGKTSTGKEFSNPLMAGSLPKTISAKFWNTATSKTVNSVKQIHAIVDDKAVVISESSVRNDLLFDDEDGITCLTNDEIFENLALMGNLDSKKFLMYPRFLQLFLNNQLKDLPEPFNDTYDTPSHTKKVFSNMARQSKGFSGKVTPLFDFMLVQNHAPEGEVSHEHQTEAHIEQILPSPSTYHRKHRKTQKHRRSKKVTKLPQTSVPLDLGADKAVHKEGTRFERVLEKPNEPPLPEGHTSRSGEGSMENTFELMDTVSPTPHDSPLPRGYTPGSDEGRLKLKELMAMCTKLSKQVLDLEKEKDAQVLEILKLKQRVKKLERKRKSSISHLRRRIYRQVESFDDDLDEEDAFAQERKINTATTGVSAVSAPVTTAGVAISTVEPKTPPTITVTAFIDEDLTIAQTLVKMRSEKAKEKGVAFRDVEETPRLTRSTTTLQPLPTIDPKDKGKGVLVEEEPEKPEKVKRRDQGAQKEKQKARRGYNAALAKEFDEIQARMDANHELAVRLTHEEQEKYTIEERARLLVEYFERRKKQLAAERAEAIRNKPPTRAQKLYQKEQKWINDFKPMDSEEDGSNTKKAGKRIKRIADSTSKQKSPKKSKVIKEQEFAESNEKATADYEQEKEDLIIWLAVVPNEDETVDPEILSNKYPIVDWESQNLRSVDMEDIHVYKIIRADVNTSYHKTFSSMLRKFDKQDLMDLHRLVMKRFKDNTPEGYNLLIWGDLKVMFKPNAKDEVWSNQQDWTLISWKLYENYGVHSLIMDGTLTCFNMLVEKRYPLIKEMLKKMLNWKLEAEAKSTMAFELLKFIKSQVEE